MITSLRWVPRGSNKETPILVDLDDEELKKLNEMAGEQLDMAKDEMKEYLEKDCEDMEVDEIPDSNESAMEEEEEKGEEEDPLAKYNLDDYDEEEDIGDDRIFAGLEQDGDDDEDEDEDGETKGTQDPYPKTIEDDEDSEDELEVLKILPTDSLLLVAKTDEEISQLEVYNYEEAEANMYVHHDSILPSFPLCLEWLNFRPKADPENKGSFVAVGTLEPEIEIWDLDIIDAVYPVAILGDTTKKNDDKKSKKAKKVNDQYHVDAVIGLNWNKLSRNLLASSSADTTVKLWDLAQLKCIRSYSHHTDKVQCVQWHPVEPTVLVTGGFDRQVVVFDSRSPDSGSRWNLSADVECIKWDPHNINNFLVSTEDGLVRCYDVRSNDHNQPLYTINAHDKSVSTFDINPLIPNCLVTGSVDRTIKIWNINDNKPSMVLSRDFELGQVFSLTFNPDTPYTLAMAGSSGYAKVWDISSNTGVRKSFISTGYTFLTSQSKMRQPISVNNDENDMSDDE